ncbi:conserved protein of unknown function [Pseudodesulfovibrio profundus]|uniref:Holin of 3TMs, for gene-transfer release n=1 Tax=Pseudodesulfovibrio profundus TaxID=57320 RepID=A0A2C8FEN2_9BACT|nr:holin family protein [Pseudodesulfovibrio profundus]SOB60626.1 conserved protein of unknown function [Pseudodesulfovibrio profundus]
MFGLDDAVGSVFDFGKTIVDKIWPDADEAEKRKFNQFMAELTAHVKLVMGQLEVNKTEAGHKSIFVAGWRPFIGWVCGAGLAYQFLVYPLLTWLWSLLIAFSIIPATAIYPPALAIGTLVSLIGGMLGLGAVRTVEHIKGVAKNSLK